MKPSTLNRMKIASVVAISFSALSLNAHAAMDAAPIVLIITDVITVIAAVGLAALSVVVTAKTFKWVRQAL